ncbi:alpha/beta-hydrolase [Massarina eburnea CBS 473.64]|uniref:Alpha/beta-hydrolase n=1 Tax=Massarina eburnea CBS 473.64 TaxID=1395130 RepID=A0A6A6SFA9_9PLEO|nr:alpha/beta-hydrolase [Massarina eburnea CBS 473.64]
MCSNVAIPRPGRAPASQKTIPGPTEATFTSTFGTLLPPAQFLDTANGKAAYYEILPISPPASGNRALDKVLFIHGVQTPAIGMLPLARALHKSFPHAHFALVDLWGHGLSDTPILPHDPSIFHSLIDALLDQLRWPSAHLVGFSFGGALAIGYTISRSSKVRSYTLVAPAGLIPSSSLTSDDLAKLRGDDDAVAKKWAFEWLEGGELVVPENWKERVAKGEVVAKAVKEWEIREHPGHMASVAAIVRDGGIFDADAEFVEAVKGQVPGLAIIGALDSVCSKEYLERVGFGDIVVVPEIGHEVVRERVPEVAGSICEFWSKLGDSSD